MRRHLGFELLLREELSASSQCAFLGGAAGRASTTSVSCERVV
ncbi:hypothetical protein DB30_05825 [Enhygromyxa salina]|uniref:Uncharacterized protein n=1 Tax=Enhygromyxa salina TaxID=215803 RepID=A0A0C2CW67_9BACT|nr:hypothetical protein DB30_05825 [Enhygromyxa salina]